MHISIAELSENLGYNNVAVRYLVEYGYLKPEEGKEVMDHIGAVKLIFAKLPREIQTNGEKPVMSICEVLESLD